MITIKTNGVEITVETAEEFHIVMGHNAVDNHIETVNYVEMHKRGRTTVQIAWIATNTDIVLLGMEDSHANES